MTKFRLAAVALVVAALSTFGASAANAAYTQSFDVVVAGGNVEPGATFTVTFTSTYPCSDWSLNEFEGQGAPGGSGTTYEVELTAPDKAGTYPISADCTWDPATVGVVAPLESSSTVVPAIYSDTASSDTLLAADQVDSANGTVVVGDAGAGDDGSEDEGGLPDTGGSNSSLFIIGGGLVLAGVGITVATRRRKSAA